MNDRMNSILMLTDQSREDSVGFFGASDVHTFHLGRLAEQGIQHER
ncbi:MAG: hypothetical protein VX910_11325 [Candidatus Latescibacterota bacterium]|nr:hypothetical protein [Candidatus Latescibacterota bacterium]